MNKNVPERLTRWMLGHLQPIRYSLSIDHPAQEDLAWAADEIDRLKEALETITNGNIRYSSCGVCRDSMQVANAALGVKDES
jgi:protein involved in temperature-dependent protein secretion